MKMILIILETTSTTAISSGKLNIKSGLKELKEKADQKAEEQNSLRSNVTYKLIDLYEIRYNHDVMTGNLYNSIKK